MLINNISQSIHNEMRKLDGSRKTEREKELAEKKNSGTEKSGSDNSELSTRGKQQSLAQSDMYAISSMLRAQPDQRADKIEEIKLKLSSGFYNSEAFVDKLADKLLSNG
ncbi:MAG: flagellar biosynthesis anti-sigma factor FlgM [Chitinispirillales bacterium]|nr:flagellar biosynthesis anti-sigma factor FlgM [Chitinispirillales bacterium]